MLAKNKPEPAMPESEMETNLQLQEAKTILAEDTFFKGNFESNESMIIHGEVQGNIKSTSDVTLSGYGKLTGNLTAENVTIAGISEGDIQCNSIVEIAEKGKVEGALNASRFIMSEESVFEGNLKIRKQKKAYVESVQVE